MTDDIAQLVENEIPRLMRYARVLTRDSTDAEDLVQECLVRALENIDRWQPGTNMRAWLFTIMHRLFLNSRRRPVMPSLEDADVTESRQIAPARQEDNLALLEVQKAFDGLSDDHREILLLVAVEGLKYEEAAGLLAVPVGTVRSRLSRAREALETNALSSPGIASWRLDLGRLPGHIGHSKPKRLS